MAEESTALLRGSPRAGRAARVSQRVSQWFGLTDSPTDSPTHAYTLSETPYTQAWYHGQVTADAAERRLRIRGAEDGMFLIRERPSMQGDYVLTMACDNRVRHFLIKGTSRGLQIGDSPVFRDLTQLVAFFTNDPAGLPCTLTTPCTATGDAHKEAHPTTSPGMSPPRSHLAMEESEKGKGRKARPKSAPFADFDCEKGIDPKVLENDRIRRKLAERPVFKPYFMNVVIMLQIITMTLELAFGKLAPIGFEFKNETQIVPMGFADIPESLTRQAPMNMFIGPPTKWLLAHGAKYTPCMRKDTRIFAEIAKQKEEEELYFGCCANQTSSIKMCAQTRASDCIGGVWSGAGTSCSDCTSYKLRPCCTKFDGTCEIVTKDYCNFVNGYWNEDATTCSEVSCLEKTCGLGLHGSNPNQWWRFFTALFMHAGILHALLSQFLLMEYGIPIEKHAGWFRMFLIYFISGVGGFLTSGILTAELPQCGAAGAVYGLLGVAIVELFQNWQILEHKYRKLFFLVFQIAAFLLIGTLPWIDNWAHIGGFVFGVISAIVFLPYITFGTWDKFRKRCLVFFCFPILIILFILGFVLFYKLQTSNLCPGCEYLQCIPWTPTFCDNQLQVM